MNYTIAPTHISEIRVGDVVELDGRLRTVCSKDLKRDTFFGESLWGDSYRCGTVLVPKALILTPKPDISPCGR